MENEYSISATELGGGIDAKHVILHGIEEKDVMPLVRVFSLNGYAACVYDRGYYNAECAFEEVLRDEQSL